MPPWKSYYNPIGLTVENLHEFCEKLFGNNQRAFRDSFFNLNNEDQLRNLLNTNKIFIPLVDDQGAPLRIMLVDVENARTKVYPPPIDPDTMPFYLLVMPPVPRTYDPQMQNWESSWYHAIVDGFGM
jgi:hypothetical protein